MLDSMRLHTKLAAALSIPLAALIAISSFVVVLSAQDAEDAEQEARQAREQAALATSAAGPSGVATTLQDERISQGLALLGVDPAIFAANMQEESAGFSMTLPELRARSDAAIATFEATVAAAPETVRTRYAPAVAALDDIADIRRQADVYTAQGPDGHRAVDIMARYEADMAKVFDANGSVSLAIENPRLREAADVINLISRNKEAAFILTVDIVASLIGVSAPAPSLELINSRAHLALMDQELLARSSGEYRQIVADALAEPGPVNYRAHQSAAVNGQPTNIADIIGEPALEGWAAMDDATAVITDRLDADAAALQSSADQAVTDARTRQRNAAIGAGLVVVITALLALAATRSISRPLRRLARDAEDMARRRLPDAVRAILETPVGEDVVVPALADMPERGGYEAREMATALNLVQRSASELAVEQAVLRRNISDSFINLGRRNQNLLSRQIDAITQMERSETDPESLDQLFALDHLATRMRRNAESLLLLGGLDTSRRWSAPVPLVDVLRGALGEVEDYRRVQVLRLDDVSVKGSSAADLTHLIAELVENALQYSPPQRPVDIMGVSSESRYTLAIVDSGVGMDESERERANRRLAGAESFTVAPSRYLGHYVVGRQAARLGAAVRLQPAPTGGITAQIDLSAVVAPDTEIAAANTAGRADLDAADLDAAAAPAPPAPEVPPAPAVPPAPVPAAPAPARRDHEVSASRPAAAADRRREAAAPSGSEGGITSSGYRKRVRGANAPRTDVLAARRSDETGGPPAAATAEGVRDLLNGLQAGVEQGRAQITRSTARADHPHTDPETEPEPEQEQR